MTDVVTDPWNRSDERALINMVTPATADRLIKAQAARPDLFGLDEGELLELCRTERITLTATDNRIRLAFWLEYDRAQSQRSKMMNMVSVFGGMCTHTHFYDRYLRNPYKTAWMATRPASYEDALMEAHSFAAMQLRDVLSQPHVTYDSDGNPKVDTRLAELKAKIYFGFDNRLKGSVVQRVEQKNMNLNFSTNDDSIAKAAMTGTMEEMEKRLEDIRKRQKRARAELPEKTDDDIKNVPSEVITPDETPS